VHLVLPLSQFIKRVHLDLVDRLLLHGGGINWCSWLYDTPLTVVAEYGGQELPGWVLELGAKINSVPSANMTALAVAVSIGNLENSKFLLSLGAKAHPINAVRNAYSSVSNILSSVAHQA
jgi:hypothetical protein